MLDCVMLIAQIRSVYINVLTLSTVMLSLGFFNGSIAYTPLRFTENRNRFFSRVLGGETVYYGVTDAANEGTWVCEGTGQTLATATGPGTGGPLFYRSQPDSNGDEDCGYGRPRNKFFLGDANCAHSYYFLCEKP